jgi:hypothetical protein
MKKFIGFSVFLFALYVLFGQPVYGIRICTFKGTILTEVGRVEMVRQAIMQHVSDPVYKENYYPEIQQDLERMFAVQKECAAKNGDENCYGQKLEDSSSYSWNYKGGWLDGWLNKSWLTIDFQRLKVWDISFIIGHPTCDYSGDIESSWSKKIGN